MNESMLTASKKNPEGLDNILWIFTTREKKNKLSEAVNYMLQITSVIYRCAFNASCSVMRMAILMVIHGHALCFDFIMYHFMEDVSTTVKLLFWF